MFKYIQWFIYFLPVFFIGLLGRVLSPIACLFIIRQIKGDTVKRLGKKYVELPRDNLVWWLSWFNTDDNNTDEWWYGLYNILSPIKSIQNWTQEDYDSSKFIRWFCRVSWLQRNSMYTFNRTFFSKPLELIPLKYFTKGIETTGFWYELSIYNKSFQLKANIPFGFGYFNSVNIGWKSHKDKDTLLYAGRILGIRNR